MNKYTVMNDFREFKIEAERVSIEEEECDNDDVFLSFYKNDELIACFKEWDWFMRENT